MKSRIACATEALSGIIRSTKNRKEPINMNIEIADRLIKMRKAHGFSQEELAEKLGISRQAVSKWERAESSPDTDNLIMLSRLYGVSLDTLLATEEEIPRPEPEEVKEAPRAEAPRQEVHISFREGINVTDDDGSKVHVGWDGIHVHDGSDGERVDMGSGDPDINTCVNDIEDIEMTDEGVYFTMSGERLFAKWEKGRGKRKAVYKKQRPNGMWRTVVIDETGRKTVVDSWSEPKTERRGEIGGFPYAVLVTGVFLLLGFLKNWWHPAWLLFLTIPVYYSVGSAIRRNGFNALDVVVPVVITAGYCVLGYIYKLWHPLWLMLLAIPLYYAVSAAIRRSGSRPRLTGIYAVIVTVAYVALGFAFGETAWKVGWLLYLTVPMFSSIAGSVQKNVGIRWLERFPWELLIVGGYLFVGLMFGIWHPTWVAFILIPVLRWAVSAIAGKGASFEFGSDEEDYDDDDD